MALVISPILPVIVVAATPYPYTGLEVDDATDVSVTLEAVMVLEVPTFFVS